MLLCFFFLLTQLGRRGGECNAAQISAVGAPGSGGGKANANKQKKKSVTFKSTYGKSGVEFRYYKMDEFSKLTQPQKDELTVHRKSNGNYKGAWTGKSGGSNRNGADVSKATVAAMINENDAGKEKATSDREAFKAALLSDVKGILTSEIAAMGGRDGVAKRLRTAGANVASADAENSQEAAAERCATALMDKFNSMGTKALNKSG